MQFPQQTTLEYIALLKILVSGKLGYLKKPDGFPILPLKSRTYWHGLKRRWALNVRNLEASLQITTFDLFTKKMMGLSLGISFMTALAKVYENIFQGL